MHLVHHILKHTFLLLLIHFLIGNSTGIILQLINVEGAHPKNIAGGSEIRVRWIQGHNSLS